MAPTTRWRNASAHLVGIVADPCLGGGDVHLAEHVQDLLHDGALGYVLVYLDGLAHLVSYGEHRVEGGHGVLDDQRDLASPDFAHLFV